MNQARRPRALVTGASGFIGSHLLAELRAHGWSTHAVMIEKTRQQAHLEMLDEDEAHRHDGSTESLIAILQQSRPDVVFHLAAMVNTAHAPEQVRPLIESNVLFGAQLMEAMAQSGARLLVNTGTSWQNYHSDSYRPVCLYAATKQAFETLLEYYVDCGAMRAVTLRLFDTYGPQDRRNKLFADLRRSARENVEVAISAGEQKIDIVYVDDITRAYRMAAERLLDNQVERSEVYAVSSGEQITLRQLVEAYAQATGYALRLNWGARPYREREVMRPWSKGLPVPGWRPQISLIEGIRRMEGLAASAPAVDAPTPER